MTKTTRKLIPGLLFASAFLLSMTLFSNAAKAEVKAEKEWTFLLFLNGNNNLDYFGAYNINQMEEVGSTNDLNMVVQWASLKNKTTKRLLVKKDNDTTKVTSPTVEDVGNVDMGDYKELVNFIEWGHKNYPAKKYMVAVWNHGNGWQFLTMGAPGGITRDISYDDNTGNKITTEELGVAMSEAAKIIGRPLDIYGSDACLMAMAEVASEMKSSVSYFVGSQDLEPGYGWPYNTWMKRWAANPKATAADVSIYLSEEYIKAYSGGIYGNEDVTFSSIDMSKYEAFTNSLKNLSASLASLGTSELTKTKAAVNSTLGFYTPEYKDIVDFIDNLTTSRVGINTAVLQSVKDSAAAMTVYGVGTGSFKKAKGISVWIPASAYELNSYKARYEKFDFNKSANWLDFLEALN